MSWITLDTKLGRHPKMAALPSDTARYGWVMTLLEAKEQRTPGTFASANHFRFVMSRHGRFLEDYIRVGLMDREDDGTIRIHDWQRHQWAANKARQREDIDETSEGQREDASRAVSVPVYVSSSTEGVQGEPDAFGAFYSRTGSAPGSKMQRWLNDIAKSHGERRLTDLLAATPMGPLNPSDYIRSIQDVLRLEDARAEKAEVAAEERRTTAKRAELRALPPATDISDAEAKRLAREYHDQARRPA